ncbi:MULTISPECIES: ABC transporter ATP-binding protein [unclassified Beijerinckia]|uniref:ABC transporter ATP-binding protein n=1 Tax=unclassified Beijerinckia TaxID=2638183 RepID=UPI00089D34B1|nr:MULTISPECIES: ABC transporter ATP-binding protein [unclassified Beijerinckia]MDH7799635.1 branched-chain amino acid transport system ATP-binding protein [Beijerinckia sp. GAS462]SEB48309.1 amino acid/amide ABC transporter ATP-binding protein 2, HAAT family [Beijerinckia sp. 28-YEA-48]
MSIGISAQNLVAGYGPTIVLDGLSVDAPAGTTLAVLGRNGVGKTTLLCTLMGLTNRTQGAIQLGKRDITALPTHQRVHAGLCYVPQERRIFPSLTVAENLAVSVIPGGWTPEAVFDLFPSLAARRNNAGNQLSGGEQQMLAVGRALVGKPDVLLLDEPMEGLAPIIVETLFEALGRIRKESGMTMLLVEQKIDLAMDFAQDAIVLDRGKVVWTGTTAALKADEEAQHNYLSVGV